MPGNCKYDAFLFALTFPSPLWKYSIDAEVQDFLRDIRPARRWPGGADVAI